MRSPTGSLMRCWHRIPPATSPWRRWWPPVRSWSVVRSPRRPMPTSPALPVRRSSRSATTPLARPSTAPPAGSMSPWTTRVRTSLRASTPPGRYGTGRLIPWMPREPATRASCSAMPATRPLHSCPCRSMWPMPCRCDSPRYARTAPWTICGPTARPRSRPSTTSTTVRWELTRSSCPVSTRTASTSRDR